ncbi:MAG TPA: AMP-binding protein, partial [Actinomycetota bacterium]|nr:AMP-binding protein [Actinomycetota bacterium]
MDPLTTGIGQLLEAQADAVGQRPFLSFGDGTTLSYADVALRAAKVRRLLEGHGIGPGDRVALMLANSLFYPVAWLGIISRGAVAVPVNSRLGPDDAGHVIGHSRARLVICDDGTSKVARAAGERSPIKPAVVEVGSGEHDPDILTSTEPMPLRRIGTRALANV